VLLTHTLRLVPLYLRTNTGRHFIHSHKLAKLRRNLCKVTSTPAGTTIYRGLRKLGASHELALQTAGSGGRWWSHSGSALNKVLTVSYFDSLGIPRLT
jgi:hypothetical protein